MDRQKFTTKSGVDLSYLQAGDNGVPIVFLHGITAGALTYDGLGDSLAANHRVYALDFRGHGESDKPGGPYTSDVYSADTIEFIRHVCGDEPIVLVGHSLGSMIAANVAASGDVPLRGAVLEDPPMSSGESDPKAAGMITTIFTALQNAMKAHHARGNSIEFLAKMLGEGPAFGDTSKKNKDLVSEADLLVQAILFDQCDYHVLDVITGDEDIGFKQPADYLPSINVPVHVMVGAQDKGSVISEADYKKAVALIPGATGAMIDSVGHLIHEHAPDWYRAELDGFLAKVC